MTVSPSALTGHTRIDSAVFLALVRQSQPLPIPKRNPAGSAAAAAAAAAAASSTAAAAHVAMWRCSLIIRESNLRNYSVLLFVNL